MRDFLFFMARTGGVLLGLISVIFYIAATLAEFLGNPKEFMKDLDMKNPIKKEDEDARE